MKNRHLLCAIFFTIQLLAMPTPSLHAEDSPGLSDGQMLYVPAYSHIYHGDLERPFYLTVTLSIRNIDPRNAITVNKIDYHETEGYKLTRYLLAPKVLKPLESIRYVIPENDKAGGSGANFIVEWKADKPVNPPVVESIMIGTYSQQGISFTSRGIVILPPEN